MSINKWVNFFIVSFFIQQGVVAQQANHFSHKAILPAISQTGFFKINLPPAFLAKSVANFNDIRLLDENNVQVPYLLKTNTSIFAKTDTIEFPVLSVQKQADKRTHFIIKNASNKAINQLLLFIKNTDVARVVTLSGSNDGKQWFVIKEDILLDGLINPEGGNAIFVLHFPTTNYPLFDIIINGENELPLDITKAAVYTNQNVYGKYLPMPLPTIWQKDSSNKASYVYVQFNDNYWIDKISFLISSPALYNRQATVQVLNGKTYETIDNITLHAEKPLSFPIHTRAKQLRIVIDNADNPPLKIHSIQAFQLNKYLLAYLENSHFYQLYIGDAAANEPNYDIASFANSIKDTLPEIKVDSILTTKTSIVVVEKKKRLNDNKGSSLLMWLSIIGVLILLLFFTFKIVKEVNKKT